jgi:hypothetical protein
MTEMTVMLPLLAVRIVMVASILAAFARQDGGWPPVR